MSDDAAPTETAAGPGQTRWPAAVVALGAVATILVVVAHRGRPLTALGLAVVVAVSTWLSIIDLREHRLPNRIVGPLALAVAVWIGLAGALQQDLSRSWRAFGLAAIIVAVLLVANLLGGMGMGDVKYGFPMASTVAWFGWDALVITIMMTTFAGAVVAVAVLLTGSGRGRQLPYGPYMAIGMVAGLLSAGTW